MKLLAKTWALAGFLGFYFKEMITANLRLARDALTPTHHMRPAVIPVPLEVRTDFEILLLSNLLAMTPGTLCLDVSADKTTMFVHGLYVADEDAARRDLKAFEAHVLKLLR